MPRYGSEEFYNVPYMQLYNQGQSRPEDLIERGTDRMVRTQENMGREGMESRRAMGDMLSKNISELPGKYQDAKLKGQQGRGYEADIAYKGIQSEEARARMDEANRQTAFKTGLVNPNDPKSMTREQADWQNKLDMDKATRENQQAQLGLTRQQIEIARQGQRMEASKYQTSENIRKREDLATILKSKTGDEQGAQAEIDKYISSGGNPDDVKVAQHAAKTGLSAAQSAKDLEYNSSPQGAVVNSKSPEISKKLDNLAKLKQSSETYKKSTRGTELANHAVRQATRATKELGLDEGEIQNAILREQSIDTVYGLAKQEIQKEINAIAIDAGPYASTSAKNQIEGLQKKLDQIDAIAGGQGEPDLYGSGQGGAGTFLTNALGKMWGPQGGANPQQAGGFQQQAPAPQQRQAPAPQPQQQKRAPVKQVQPNRFRVRAEGGGL